MRFRTRLWLLASPLLGLAPRLHAQPTSQTQTGSPTGPESHGEVQVGAGTQGDVTTGSSGTKAKQAKDSKADDAQGGAARAQNGARAESVPAGNKSSKGGNN